MMFVEPTVSSGAGQSSEALFAALEQLFIGDWRGRMPEIAECMVALRRQAVGLRSLIGRVATKGAWPTLQGAQSFILFDCPHVVLRVNLWFPKTAMAEHNDRYRKYLSIDEMHNHDFEFLTICLSGSGYVSNFYRDNAHSYDAMPGDTLDLSGPFPIRLNGERVLFVEKDLDYHSQQWPDDFSTTLNCIPKLNEGQRVQYVVDPDNFRVLQSVRN